MRYNPKAKLDQSQVDFASKYRHYFDPGESRRRKSFNAQHPGPSGVVSVFGDSRRLGPVQMSARQKAIARKLRKSYDG